MLKLSLLAIFSMFMVSSFSQTGTNLESITSVKPLAVSGEYFSQVSAKADAVGGKVEKRVDKTFEDWQDQEQKILKKLYKIDSLKAKQLFDDVQQKYARLSQNLEHPASLNHYIPSLDTLTSSLNFLQQNPAMLSNIKNANEKMINALEKVKFMNARFQKAEEIRKFLKERRQYLKEQLQQFGFAKELKKLNKQVYYYSGQLNEYKQLLKDHKKAERKVLQLFSKTKMFQDFMRRNSKLASLFRLPADPNDPSAVVNLAGLQTRAQVNNLIQQQLSAGGPAAQQQFTQNLQQAQGQLNELKNKMNQLGQRNSDEIIPEGFKPNNQRTKSFLQRLELGTNIQSQKTNGFFPATSDIGLSLGYKPNDKSVLGIGASYKMGWGKNIRNINITHQGVGIRSFIDWKIKGSFWLSGGYEMNYRNAFNRITELKDLPAWQESGLVGLSKILSLKTKFFKRTKMQLLWDFMSYQQVPRTQTILFRVGYSFK
jgi:hypothetical protein